MSHGGGNETRKGVNSVDEKIVTAMKDFCVRALSGGGAPQEVAVLPEILALLLEHEKTASGN